MSNIKEKVFHSSINCDFDESAPLLNSYDDIEKLPDNVSLYQSITSIASEQYGNMNVKFKDSMQSTRSILKSSRSITSQSSLGLTLVENLSEDRESTLFMTICNILPILQGSAVFSIPYAVMVGGLSFIPACILICILADVTGGLLVDCLYSVSPRSKIRKRVHGDYGEVTFACWGKAGSRLVTMLNVAYLVANNIVNIVLLGKCSMELIGGHININETLAMILSSIFLIPLLFIKQLSIMSYVSFIGVTSIIVCSMTAVVVFIQHWSDWQFNAHSLPWFNASGFPLAIGIVMYSVIINSILPQIEGSMKNPKQIGAALHIAFVLSTLIKLVFGVLGALTFGLSTKQLVALNVSEYAVYAKYVISISLCLYAITNYALMFFVVFEHYDDFLRRKNFHNIISVAAGRILLTVFCVAIAIEVPFFALVSGIVGAVIGTCLVFIFPVLFHLKLKWKEISKLQKLMEIILLMVGIVTGAFATYSSISSLVVAIIAKMHGLHDP